MFAPELPGLDRDEIRRWYNGYDWLGGEKVYNPFDIPAAVPAAQVQGALVRNRDAAVLVDTLLRRGVASPELDGMVGTEALLSAFDVDEMATEALLFQTGYLTIGGEEDAGGETLYRLEYPNHEVRQSLNRSLLRAMTPEGAHRTKDSIRLRQLLADNDFEGLEALFRSFFAGIPYQWHVKNGHRALRGVLRERVLLLVRGATGLDVRVEDSTSRGRLDMAVLFDDRVYLFEFKTVEKAPEGGALAQLAEKGYADKYRSLGRPIHLVGVEFSREDRNVAAFAVERA